MNTIQNNKYQLPVTNILLFLYCIILIMGVFTVSTVSFASKLAIYREYVIILLGFISIILQKHSIKQWIWFGIGIGICGFSYLFSYNYVDFLFFIIIAFSMSTLSPKRLLIYSVCAIFISLFSVYLLSSLKIIPNLLFYRDNIVRQSLGTMYPLTFAGFIFFCCAGLIVINPNSFKIKWLITFILLFGCLVVYKINGARNDALNIVLLIICSFSNTISDKVNDILCKILSAIVFGVAFLSIFISQLIPYTSNLYLEINNLLSGRLQLQYTLLSIYKPRLLEQNIQQNGLGGTTGTVMNYFYIDNSYVRLLFMGGLLLFLFLGLTLFIFVCKMINYKLYLLVYVTLVVIICGITEDSVVSTITNIFIPMLLMDDNIILKDFRMNDEEI